MESSMLIWILIAISFLTLGLLFSLWRQRREGSQASEELVQLTSSLQLANERLERELRNAINESARGGRQELIQTLGTFQQSLVQQGAEATRTQNGQMDAFAQQLALLQKHFQTRSPFRCNNYRRPMPDASQKCVALWKRNWRSFNKATPPSSMKCVKQWTKITDHLASALGRKFQASGRPFGAGAQRPR
jgi:hypothetical protein